MRLRGIRDPVLAYTAFPEVMEKAGADLVMRLRAAVMVRVGPLEPLTEAVRRPATRLAASEGRFGDRGAG